MSPAGVYANDGETQKVLHDVRILGKRAIENSLAIRGRKLGILGRRVDVVAKHMASLVADGIRPPSSGLDVMITTHNAPPSRVSISDLDRIFIADMVLGEAHRGAVLVLRTVTPPRHTIGSLITVVEDEQGSVHSLRLYSSKLQNDLGSSARDDRQKAMQFLPKGSVLAIKEPYCELTFNMRESRGIRVDHPSDCLRLPLNSPLYPRSWHLSLTRPHILSADLLQANGTIAYQLGRYHDAVMFYSEGLNAECSTETSISLYTYRAQTYLSLGAFFPALKDYRTALKLSRYLNETILHHYAKVLYVLRRFHQAFDALENLTLHFPLNQEAKVELKRSSRRVSEQRTGRYMLPDIRNALLHRCPRIDIADHIGPITFLKDQDTGKSRCVATRDIGAGELLLSLKAFETAYYSPKLTDGLSGSGMSGSFIVYNALTGVIEDESGIQLSRSISNKLLLNPELIQEFFTRIGTPWVDEPTGKKIILDGRPVIDFFVIDGIRRRFSQIFSSVHQIATSETLLPQYGIGLWLLPPEITYCSSGNTFSTFLGDIQLLRASRRINKNDEIKIYRRLNLSSSSNNSTITNGQVDGCTCNACEIGILESSRVQILRMEIVAKVQEASQAAPLSSLSHRKSGSTQVVETFTVVDQLVKVIEGLCQELESTYSHPSTVQHRFDLVEPLFYLTACYNFLQNSSKILHTTARALDALGFRFLPSLEGYETVSPTVLNAPSSSHSGARVGQDVEVRIQRHGIYHECVAQIMVKRALLAWQLGQGRCAESWRQMAEDAIEMIVGHRGFFVEIFAGAFEEVGWKIA